MKRDPHILVARYTDLEVRDMTPLKAQRMGGRWAIEKFKACGRDGLGEVPGTRRRVMERKNVITNTGLNTRGNNPTALGTGPRIHVGTGTTPETVFDTALETWVAQKQVDNPSGNGVSFVQTSAPYFGSHQRKARFAAGFAGGPINVTELMIANNIANADAFSRVLTVDGMGSPAAVPVDVDEAFDVFYTLENYPVHHDVDGTGQIDISGILYNYTIRAANITTPARWSDPIYKEQSVLAGIDTSTTVYGSDATLGAITSTPSATSTASVGTGNSSASTYLVDSFQRTQTINWGISEGNVTGGIKALRFFTNFGMWQVLFDPVIPKDGTKTLSLPFTTVWSRHV